MDGIQLNITTTRSLKRKSSANSSANDVVKPKKPSADHVNSGIESVFFQQESEMAEQKPNEDSQLEKDLIKTNEVVKPIPSPRIGEPLRINPVIDEGEVTSSATETLFSQDHFESLALHSHLVKNVADKLGFSKMTLVQKLGIPVVQKGADVMVKSQTGSGKTLVYALPVVNKLGTMDPPISRSDGVYCLVILPTRELAVQSFDVFHKLCQSFIKITPGCLSGGEKKKSEKARLRKGINILVSTPGRLLDHLKTSANLTLSMTHLQFLVIDEADRLLEAGFEQQIGEILQIIKQGNSEITWQTILLSATLTPAVERLVSLSLKNPEYIDVQALSAASASTGNDQFVISEPILAVPEKLKQYYAITPTKLKLAAVTTFLLRKRRNKVVVFLPTQDVVEFMFSLYENVFDQLALKMVPQSSAVNPSQKTKLFRLHGEMGQSERSDVFRRYSQSDSGFLFSTDVAARGLDLPLISWVVQFQAAETPAVYVHRVGRTARAGRSGSSILFLIPNETRYVKMMRQDYRMNIKSIRFSSITAALDNNSNTINNKQPVMHNKGDELRVVFEVQRALDDAVNGDKALQEMARKAYISFVRSYATYRNDQRLIFNVRNGLHFGHVARCFGLKDETPTEINSILRRNPPPPPNRPNNRGSESGPDAYPTWKDSTFHKQNSGYEFDGKEANFRPRTGTKVVNGRRVGRRDGGGSGYQVAMQRCSEFASGL